MIVSAGEVNAGEFDPLRQMADLAERHGAWLHVDGAFGLFAHLKRRHEPPGPKASSEPILRSPDGHKWLNVPYESGFAFIKGSLAAAGAVFGKPGAAVPARSWRIRTPSGRTWDRRCPGVLAHFAVWATLRAYGRSGYRAIVERHLAQARHLAERVDEAPDLERLADVGLNIVCFRFAS